MTTAGHYRLQSEMARVCLPAPERQLQRQLAWTNSICLLFLVIGVVGFRPMPPPAPRVKPLEPPVVEIVEPAPPPPATTELKPDEEPKDAQESDAPRLVMVTPESPAINFSVPTIGNILVRNAVAVAPPVAALARPVAVVNAAPSVLGNTGEGGDRPKPGRYPPLAESLRQEGKVVLFLTVDEAGVITSAEVEQSSGSSILDHFSLEWVKKHWTLSPGQAGRHFLAPFNYELKR
jgi:TonB family protein